MRSVVPLLRSGGLLEVGVSPDCAALHPGNCRISLGRETVFDCHLRASSQRKSAESHLMTFLRRLKPGLLSACGGTAKAVPFQIRNIRMLCML